MSGIHRSFLDVGVDVVETNAFGAFSVVLAEYGLQDRVEEINLTAARLAREAADEAAAADASRPRWVAGNLGPGTRFPTLGQIPYLELRNAYEEQATALVKGGVDLLLIETVYDLLQAKAAINAAKRAMVAAGRRVPIQVQVTIELTGRMLPGTEIGAALSALDPMRPDVIGLNCATGPAEMGEAVRYLSQHSRLPLSTQPNAGLPSVVDGKMHYDLTPEQLADHLERFITELGVSIVGGCCGTTPDHLRAVVERCRDLVPAPRTVEHEPGAASIYSNVAFHQDTSFLVVGERTNANGSKKFREAMLEADWDTTVAMARDQVKEGAHVLDVCVDYTGADGVSDMTEVASRLATQASVPLMVDSTEAPVVEAALMWIGGRPVLNSVNLEEGDDPGTRLDKFLTLAREYGAAVVCTCIDTEGQARTADWKVRAATAIHDIAVGRYGLEPSDLIFDPLVLPLSTGMEESRRDGIETLEGTRRIKAELPGVFTIVGLSNVSFGLNPAARHVLNSMFLHELVEAGLDAAIVHAARIIPLSKIDEHAREVCLDLIYDRRREGYDPLQELLGIFEGVSATADRHRGPDGVAGRASPRAAHHRRRPQRPRRRPRRGLGRGARGAHHRERLPPGRHEDGGRAVRLGRDAAPLRAPVGGDHEGGGLLSRTPHGEGRPGRQGDRGAGHGQGRRARHRQEPRRHHPHQQRLRDRQPRHQGEHRRDAPGRRGPPRRCHRHERAAREVDAHHAREPRGDERPATWPTSRCCWAGPPSPATTWSATCAPSTRAALFYGKDAFEGLRTMDRLVEMKKSGEEDPAFGREQGGRKLPPRKSQMPVEAGEAPPRAPTVATDNPVFTPPFLGSRVAKGIPLDDIAAYLNRTALFRNQWGYRPERDHQGVAESDDELQRARQRVLREELDKAKAKDLLIPQVAYGYYAANAEGDDVVLWIDDTRRSELTRFAFPRQKKEPWLCIADFFRSVDSGEPDYAAFMLVTMGPEVSKETRRLHAENQYTDYLKLHGLGVEMAEALAEYWHRRIREEWGFAGEDGPTLTGLFRQQYRGGRYSWGYPACPDLEDNAKVVEILGGDRVGVTVSDGFQMHPEQTTDAIICHHPQAKYFVA